jgi:peptide/nickel transport system substrate-binding protein
MPSWVLWVVSRLMSVGVWRSLVGVAMVLAIALNGCDFDQFKVEGAAVPQMVTSVLSDPKTFNYALNQQTPNVFGLTYQGLTIVNGLTAEVEPALAESWESFDDNKRIIFTLREGLKWSDGMPLTADDVVFTFNDIVFNPDIGAQVADMLRIGTEGKFPTVQKLDARRVEFVLPEPFSPLLVATAGAPDGVAIMPKHALEDSIRKKDSDGNPLFLSTWGTDTDPSKLVVNGPYRIVSYRPSERVIFERNPYYWRKEATGNIQRYIWQIVESPETSLIQFRSGDLDAVGVGPSTFSLLKKEEERGNFTIFNGGPSFGTQFVCFNLNKGSRNGKPLVDPIKSRWFNTKEFRQAVAYSIDRRTMINNLYRGVAEPQHSPLDVQTPFYLSPEQGLKTYDYDPEKAKQLLQQVGFQYNDKNQLMDAEGNRVRFTLLSPAGAGSTDEIGAQVKQDLAKVGMQVDLQPLDFSALVEKLSNTLDWEAHILALTGGVEPNDGANVWLPDGGLHAFNQKELPGSAPVEGREIADWEAEIGRLYIQGAQEFDLEKRRAIYAETQRITQENVPFIYLVNPLSMAAVRNRVDGVEYSALKGAFWNIYDLKVEGS